MQACHDGCEGDAACSLNIVIEARDFRAIKIQQTSCWGWLASISDSEGKRGLAVVEAKVFEVDVGLGI